MIKALRVLAVGLSLMCFSAVSSAAKTTATDKRIDKATTFLSPKKTARLDVEKTVVSELLNKTTTAKGEIFLGGGKFRWETTSPEKSLIVFDGQTVWTQQTEEGSNPQVTKTKLNGKSKDQILVKILSGGKISSKFRLTGMEKADETTVMKMEPVKADPTVKNFSLVLGGKPERLQEIRYTDDIGNLTKIRILKTDTVKKPAADLFKYQVPKDAEVNEL